MGREFVVDPWEDQAWTSCTCSEASPFNCTCPRVDPPLLPTPSMPPETIRPAARPVRPTIMLAPPRPMQSWPMRPSTVLRPMPSWPMRPSTLLRPMPPLPGRTPPRLRYVANADVPLLPTPLNFAPNHNPRVRESENIVRASESETSNVEASQRIPVESIPPAPRPMVRHSGDRPPGYIQVPDGRYLRVSEEFMTWANGRSQAEMINAILEDYHIM